MVARIKEYFLVEIALAAGTAFFHYLVGLNFPVSLTLGGLFCIVFLWIGGLWRIADFKPYKLVIHVWLAAILKDLGLLANVEDWAVLLSKPEFAEHRQRFTQFSFTAITPKLFARSDEQEYSTSLSIRQTLRPIEIAWQPDSWSSVGNHPLFFFRPARDGYQFGVQVASEWWAREDVRKAAHPSLRSLKPDSDGSLILGVLPYGYFPDHIRRWSEPVSFFYPFKLKQRRWATKLNALGWTVETDCPESIEHRYMTIMQLEL